MPPKRIYLDTNQFTNCIEPRVAGWTLGGLATLEAAMFTAFERQEAVFLGSQFHLEEMSRINPQYRAAVVQFFWTLVRWNLLLPTVDLAKAEVAAGRPLCGNEPFATFRDQQGLKRFSLRSANYDALAAEMKTLNATSAKRQKQMRVDMRFNLTRKFPGITPEEITKEWFKDPQVLFEDWAKDYLETSKEHYGLPDDRSVWPDPSALPTIRAMIISNLARIYFQLSENRKISDGDTHDSHHYAAASYADILVTEDKGFRDVIGKIPQNRVSLLTFNAFANSLGVSPQ